VLFCLGFLGIILITSFTEAFKLSTEKQSKELLGADIVISSRFELQESEKQLLDNFVAKNDAAYFLETDTYSMALAPAQNLSRLVLINAIPDVYPIYGMMTLAQAGMIRSIGDKLGSDEVWISKDLSHQLKIAVGDFLKLGEKKFTVADIVIADTVQNTGGGFSLAPVVYIQQEALKTTGLIKFGSLATYRYLLKFSENKDEAALAQLMEEISGYFTDPGIKLRTPALASEQITRSLQTVTDYVALMCVIVFLLTFVGLNYLLRYHFLDNLTDIAIVRVHGISRGQLMRFLFAWILVLSSLCYLLLMISYATLSPWLVSIVTDFLKVDLAGGYSLSVLTKGFVTIIITNVFAFFPYVIKVMRKEINELFVPKQFFEFTWKKREIIFFFPSLVLFFSITYIISHSYLLASGLMVLSLLFAFFMFFLLPLIIDKVDFWLLRAKQGSKRFTSIFTLALRNLVRRKVSFTFLTIILSSTFFFILFISSLEKTFRSEIEGQKHPALFMFDIQEEQVPEITKDVSFFRLSPMIRAKILKINDQDFANRVKKNRSNKTREGFSAQSIANRSVSLTYQSQLSKTEKIIAGEWSGKSVKEGEEVLITIEKRYAQRLDIKLGDTIVFEIMGVQLPTKVSAFRYVQWTSFLPNFFIVFPPGVLDDAPKTFLAASKDYGIQEKLSIQDMVVSKYPNISIVDVAQTIEKAERIFNLIVKIFTGVGFFVLLITFFIYMIIYYTEIVQQKSEFTLFHVLGLAPSQTVKMLVIQQLTLFALCFAFACILLFTIGNFVTMQLFVNVLQVESSHLLLLLISGTLFTVMMSFVSLRYLKN
jgi:putative ABC transport system permease protein